MISLLISIAIAVIFIGFVTLYTGITDLLIKRAKASLAAMLRLRLLRADFYQPVHQLTKRIARGLTLSPVRH